MQSLSNYQKSFYQAIFTNEQTLLQNAIGQIEDLEERFQIYSNNVFASLKTVLKEDFPISMRVLGEEKFNRAAFEYVRNFPPTSGCLLAYGHLFPNCLEALYNETPYIKDSAQIEWAKKEVYYAGNTTPLNPLVIGEIPTEQHESLTFGFPIATSFVTSEFSLRELWEGCNSVVKMPTHESSYCLIIRPRFKVEHYWLGKDEHRFLKALYGGKTLEVAYQNASEINPEFDLAESLSTAFSREYFTTTEIHNEACNIL